MSTLAISLIAGIALGMVVGVHQHSRVKSGANQRVIRNPDGSVYGGFFRVLFGVVILWTVLGFVVAYAITSIAKWIF